MIVSSAMRKIVVTGAGGFIGSHVCQALFKNKFFITALYKKAIHKKNCLWEAVESDLLLDSSDDLLATLKPTTIIHCAAVLPKQFYGQDADKVSKLNRIIDDKVIKYCSLNKCRLIYASSSSVYGLSKGPWDERSVVNPVGPYASAKHETEKLITHYVFDHIILRFSSPYGPGLKLRTVFKIFMENAMSDRDLQYMGTGKRQQDFISVKDIADAFLCILQNSQARGVYNIASGKAISMKELAALVIKSIPGCKSKVVLSGLSDAQENYQAIFDISQASNVLGWTPRISLKDGIVDWFNNWRQL